jgi:hypothetical protein
MTESTFDRSLLGLGLAAMWAICLAGWIIVGGVALALLTGVVSGSLSALVMWSYRDSQRRAPSSHG